ncbi:hypothetical protein AMJ85_11565 [candidate division BRC1 bacterium SM23_51]|nr:MAG: hypothetical protein AMJ85_11565 [candidate division BRC1 bacterium SM23_51]
MKAAVFVREGEIETTEIPNPEVRAGEVVIKVHGCGVCGTDLHIFNGDLKEDITPPVVLGHEITGEIVAVGEGDASFASWGATISAARRPLSATAATAAMRNTRPCLLRMSFGSVPRRASRREFWSRRSPVS